MKKLTALFLCLVLCLSCVAALASCDKNPGTTEETTAGSATTTVQGTEKPTEEPEETTAEPESDPEPAESEEETTDEEETEDEKETQVVIQTAEDLMAFNQAVNVDMEYFDDMTVVFTADIDMTGYEWTPLEGNALFGVTFEGNGHTISNLQFAVHDPLPGTPANFIGSGFVGVAVADMIFRNLTIDTASVLAYERAVGCFVGLQTDGTIQFENCSVKNFTVDGWVEYNNQDRNNGGHPISFRQAAFVGHNMAGRLRFVNCLVENVKLSGFHNLAAFVGYGGEYLDEFAFEGCTVRNLECTFSYCLSEAYTIDMPRKFVSVFFNHCQWVEKVEACVELGNTFEGVSYYDWTNNNAEYTPADFISWSDEEANPPA